MLRGPTGGEDTNLGSSVPPWRASERPSLQKNGKGKGAGGASAPQAQWERAFGRKTTPELGQTAAIILTKPDEIRQA